MTITSGFFDSQDGDRKYNASQMSSLFEGIITEGIFQNVGSAFSISGSNEAQRKINVGSGRAWVNNIWVNNDSIKVITLPNPPVTEGMKRIDAVVISVDKSISHRNADIIVISGQESISSVPPAKPHLINTSNAKQIPLCYVTATSGTQNLSPSDIEIAIGTSESPFIMAPLVNLSMDEYLALWQQEFEHYLDRARGLIQSYINALNLELDEGIVTSLTRKIATIEELILNNPLPIANGGTGSTTKSSAKEALGIRYGSTEPSSMASQLSTGDMYIYIPDE